MKKVMLLLAVWCLVSALQPGRVVAADAPEVPAEAVDVTKEGPAEADVANAGETKTAYSESIEKETQGERRLEEFTPHVEAAPEPKAGFLSNFEISGYLRHYASFNLQNVPETRADDAWKMSMNRVSLLLQLKGPLGPANFTAIGRFSREQMTSYLRDLQNLARQTSNDVDFKSHYDENELRELYLDIPVGERLKLRLGKQQVVWGESDFFQALDLVHGYDASWRSFLEPENEELRKPLILGNAQLAVPELKGTLQLLVRPGLDRDKDIGNTFDMFGGRWAQNGSRGFDLNSTNRPAGLPPTVPSLPFNYHHPKGDSDRPDYGGRWTGNVDDIAYSLNYYHTQAKNPVLFPDAGAPMGLSFIYPTVDIIGGTLSGKVPIDALDTVFRAEAAYIPDLPYNNASFQVVRKNIIRSMLGLDTNLRLENLLGTCNASMLSLQIFDTYILDHKEADQIVNAFGTREKEHSTLLTAIFSLPYRMDTVKGQLVAIQDLSGGGVNLIPSVELQIGANWRIKVEADLFYGGKRNDAGNNASFMGSFAHADQLYTRVTYQF